MFITNSLICAEPWINTSDLQLRSDIETLSDIGVIKVPITTYPLMWAGVIKNIDDTDIQNIPLQYKEIFWSVKKHGKAALSNQARRLLTVSVASSEQVLRSFGDSARGQSELTASTTNMNKHFAWNLQVNRINDPLDRDNFHYDGSYIAGVAGNWVFNFGAVEKWWGASWDSANLLSNNARTPFGLTVNRNYSDAIDLPVLSWIGGWSFTGFVSQLEETAFFKDHYFSGASFSFKPFDSLEASLRATAISGGTSKQFNTNFSDKVLTGIDVRWRVPQNLTSRNFPANIYFSVTDEGQQASFAAQQLGLSAQIKVFEQNWRIFAESTRTYPNKNSFDTTYEDGIYINGYRFNQRAIGSTYDNDSKALTLGVIGRLSRTQNFSLKIQKLKINQGASNSSFGSRHTVSASNIKTNRILANWQWQADRNSRFDVEVDFADKNIDGFARQSERFRLALGWSYYL